MVFQNPFNNVSKADMTVQSENLPPRKTSSHQISWAGIEGYLIILFIAIFAAAMVSYFG